MSDHIKTKVLLVGAGHMAEEYCKVLKNLAAVFDVIGRSDDKIIKLKRIHKTGNFYSGGLENFNINRNKYSHAIVASPIENLALHTKFLLNIGIKNILLEKPGDLNLAGLIDLENKASEADAKIWIAYNRRFYSSVKELINQAQVDGGIISSHFEFTEWVHTIDSNMYCSEVLHNWVIANSSHVLDTVFFLIGLPKSINVSVLGQNQISWHPSGSLFTGSGISVNGIPFTYHSNWQSPGRWNIEVLTTKRRFYLKPMESLQVQKIGSIIVESMHIDDHFDKEFKPGIYLQTKAFLERTDSDIICTIKEHLTNFKYYEIIAGYRN